MGTLNHKGLESLLQPIRDKINNYMPKSGGEFSGPISISNGYNKCTFSVNDSYSRITSGDSNLDFTNSGELLVNGENIINNSNIDIKLGKIVSNTSTTNEEREKWTINNDIPYEFKNGSAVAIGNDIYLLGSGNNDYNHYNYKYDTTTNTYTHNRDIPYHFYNGSAVAIGTDIYLLGGSDSSNDNYKYDTTTNTYTKMKDIPYDFHYATAVAIGTDIYLLGGYDGSYKHYNYKYDTTTNSYTKLTDIPYDFQYGSAVAVGSNIYLLRGSNIYKYDITTDKYSILSTAIPYDFYNGLAVAVGNAIYILGCRDYNHETNDYDIYNYKYDIYSNIYSELKDIPYNFYYGGGSAVSIDDSIYLLGSGKANYMKYNYKYDTKYTIYPTYTILKNIPYHFYRGSAVAIGTDIYLLGSAYIETTTGTPYSYPYAKWNYKYDTTTNTYTKMTNIPYNFYRGSAVSINKNIYLLGGANAECSQYNYKYDTITNTYTQMTNIPYDFYGGSAVSIGNNIYLLGSSYTFKNSDGIYLYPYSQYTYKYDTNTDTYTKLKNIPYDFSRGSAVAIGTDIYLLRGTDNNANNYKYDSIIDKYIEISDYNYFNNSNSQIIGNINNDIYIIKSNNLYKYNLSSHTISLREKIPVNGGSAVAIGNDIYLLGSGNSEFNNYNYKYSYTINAESQPNTYIIKPSNHSIYAIINDTTEKSYIDKNASIISLLNDEYYTEYNGNNIINNTYPITSTGITKMYIKSGAILNGKEVPCESEGWVEINILDYM